MPVVMVLTPRFIGAHSWQCGGQSSNPLRFAPAQGCGLKCSSADQSTLLVCIKLLCARGWMSPLQPPGMIKVSIGFKNNIVNEFAGTCYSGFLFSPRRHSTSAFMEQDVECAWNPWAVRFLSAFRCDLATGLSVSQKAAEALGICLSDPSVMAEITQFLKWLFSPGPGQRLALHTPAKCESWEQMAQRQLHLQSLRGPALLWGQLVLPGEPAPCWSGHSHMRSRYRQPGLWGKDR